MAERRQSIDSQSSLSSTDQRKKKSKLGISKSLLKKQSIPPQAFQSMRVGLKPSTQETNHSYMSYTEFSDSDYSNLDVKSQLSASERETVKQMIPE